MDRKLWIDNLKGFCLFMIILGHLEYIPKEIGAFLSPTDILYVPIFFFLSGWLFNNDKYSFSDFFIRKVKGLLVPYIAICCAVSVLDWNLYLSPKNYMTDALHCFIMGDGVPKASPLWFVSTLFVANILLKIGYVFSNKYFKFIYFIIMPFACYFLYTSEIRLPLRIDSALGACFIMYSAQVVKCNIADKSILQNVCITISLVLAVYGIVSKLGLLNYNIAHTWMSFPCAIGGCMALTFMFKQFDVRITPPFGLRKMVFLY